MNMLVCLVGLIMAAVGAVGLVNPKDIFSILLGWSPQELMTISTAARLVAGVIFLLAARKCRFPKTMRVLGVLCILASAVLLLMGVDNLESTIKWAAALPVTNSRCLFGFITLLGLFIAYSGLAGKKSRA